MNKFLILGESGTWGGGLFDLYEARQEEMSTVAIRAGMKCDRCARVFCAGCLDAISTSSGISGVALVDDDAICPECEGTCEHI